ncbi:(4Fe-4S)-binding protein [Desulfobacter hydrogenophilus]|uniref:(4Fe-4S)-binding protein n=1 Tax=Desulfobacter hydrogenophilus TaxID=2291 RepID=A0A328FDB2_9BACT|nr:ATP-binding protein [Desulfobacter hydrogenophilus]NDY71911.1 P-loop NTPase [Desulfobacter hydrogenophilus]QBH11955.1 (4Fe-4S)-binding protein [Desulfobacter hydrogenophilus]RAM02684.1 (4Fe-4S)-binding protein [Desulfobacter hydrogenophilus]
MKELVILSGKGGTGKTSLTAAFASLAENMMLCDADVDAADLHLIMDPDIQETHDFAGGYEAKIIPDACTGCGLCMELCRFDAVKPVQGAEIFYIDGLDCEGCGVCADLCPESAITFEEKICGQWFASKTRFGDMIHARLGIAEDNSGRLVALVRDEARKRVIANRIDLLLTDGPPGIGCPVIASIGHANAVLIVTEPTVSGIHDMERVAQLAAHFKMPAMVCINKYDLNPDQAQAIEAIAEKRNMVFVGKLPFDPAFTKAMVQGKSIMETHADSPAATQIKQIWNRVMAHPAMKMDRLC